MFRLLQRLCCGCARHEARHELQLVNYRLLGLIVALRRRRSLFHAYRIQLGKHALAARAKLAGTFCILSSSTTLCDQVLHVGEVVLHESRDRVQALDLSRNLQLDLAHVLLKPRMKSLHGVCHCVDSRSEPLEALLELFLLALRLRLAILLARQLVRAEAVEVLLLAFERCLLEPFFEARVQARGGCL